MRLLDLGVRGQPEKQRERSQGGALAGNRDGVDLGQVGHLATLGGCDLDVHEAELRVIEDDLRQRLALDPRRVEQSCGAGLAGRLVVCDGRHGRELVGIWLCHERVFDFNDSRIAGDLVGGRLLDEPQGAVRLESGQTCNADQDLFGGILRGLGLLKYGADRDIFAGILGASYVYILGQHRFLLTFALRHGGARQDPSLRDLPHRRVAEGVATRLVGVIVELLLRRVGLEWLEGELHQLVLFPRLPLAE